MMTVRDLIQELLLKCDLDDYLVGIDPNDGSLVKVKYDVWSNGDHGVYLEELD